MSDMKPRSLIGPLVLAFAFVNVLGATVLHQVFGVELKSDNFALFVGVAGYSFSQMGLISIWGVLGTGPPVIRLPWSLLLSVGMWCSLSMGVYVATGYSFSGFVFFGYCTLILCTQMCVQILLWIVSRYYGWRLVSTAAIDQLDAASQYSIKQMFVGTSLIAVAMSLVRVILPNEAWDLGSIIPALSEGFVMGTIVGLMVAFNLLPTIAYQRTAIRQQSQTDEYAIFILMVVAGTSIVELLLMFFTINRFVFAEVISLLLVGNTFQCVVVVGVMQLLHRAGIVWEFQDAQLADAISADPIDGE